MSSQTAISAMSVVETGLWAVLAFLFWRKQLGHRFPAMWAYLLLRVISAPILLGALYVYFQPWGRNYYPVYFFGYWAVYAASAVLLYFICMEVFRSVLSVFSGLVRFGTVIFHWAALASVIVSFSTISFAHKGFMVIPAIANGLMRSVSVVELCLLAFLCLSMGALGLSVRDLAFGVSMGFGILATDDLVVSCLVSRTTTLTDPLQFFNQIFILVALGAWTAYFALPEPVRKPVVLPANSTIYRWNEIASALGHPVTHVAVQQSANSFFLTDVERVVEKVLSRNLKGNESGS